QQAVVEPPQVTVVLACGAQRRDRLARGREIAALEQVLDQGHAQPSVTGIVLEERADVACGDLVVARVAVDLVDQAGAGEHQHQPRWGEDDESYERSRRYEPVALPGFSAGRRALRHLSCYGRPRIPGRRWSARA